jgi:hypothetical protein
MSGHSIPACEQRYPPGCPDPDWCSGNGLCYWNCTAGPDDDLIEAERASAHRVSEELAEMSKPTPGGGE